MQLHYCFCELAFRQVRKLRRRQACKLVPFCKPRWEGSALRARFIGLGGPGWRSVGRANKIVSQDLPVGGWLLRDEVSKEQLLKARRDGVTLDPGEFIVVVLLSSLLVEVRRVHQQSLGQIRFGVERDLNQFVLRTVLLPFGPSFDQDQRRVGGLDLADPKTFLNLLSVQVEDERERAVEDLLALHLRRQVLDPALLFAAVKLNQLLAIANPVFAILAVLGLELRLTLLHSRVKDKSIDAEEAFVGRGILDDSIGSCGMDSGGSRKHVIVPTRERALEGFGAFTLFFPVAEQLLQLGLGSGRQLGKGLRGRLVCCNLVPSCHAFCGSGRGSSGAGGSRCALASCLDIALRVRGYWCRLLRGGSIGLKRNWCGNQGRHEGGTSQSHHP